MADPTSDPAIEPSLSHPTNTTGDDDPPIAALDPIRVPMPSFAYPVAPPPASYLTPLVCDERVIARLLDHLLSKAGLTVPEAARRLGIHPNSVRQYLYGQRTRPSLQWFVRFADLCGARLYIEFPPKGRIG